MPEPALRSPWLAQLKLERSHFRLEADADCDVAVVGAGIAGVMTAYQILKHSGSSVALIEAGRIAHGATGHNAGHVTNYFERPFQSIVEEFGAEMAAAGHLAFETAWGLLDDIMAECELKTPLYRCIGHTGLTNLEELIDNLEELHTYASAGLETQPILLSVGANLLKDIPEHLRSHLLEVPHSQILAALSTQDPSFIAAVTDTVACINSALLCEELVGVMVQRYGNRLQVAEHLPVTRVTLNENGATLATHGPVITAGKVVLCTNGFENFEIVNLHGKEINTGFHAEVLGRIAYMTGFIDRPGQKAAAICYNNSRDEQIPYYYLTRRPFDDDQTLLCIGGPERDLPNGAEFDPVTAFSIGIAEDLDRVLRTVYDDLLPEAARSFMWHGLMGHTPNRLRRIGFEPRNNVLLYNLGCNGVGILPSIYGGYRIMQLLKGIDLPPSIFDPVEGDC
jgi:glycine/D-amino acid oxidase-like deaminating enzyme